MSADELLAWENAGIATIGRTSDSVEVQADEQQDAATGLNFPLHWTSTRQSWDYLFDIAIAGDLLSPRPDDRVLDLAAGTCWATELLTRLGVRTVSVDLSVEMMRRGRQRLGADGRLVFRDLATFVVARAQSLPFADASFDGVMCLNALHHVPSYAAALAEIHRVLRPGGRAVFSEPGTAHADEALSSYRMREEGIIEKAVSLPHIHRLAREAGFSRMIVVPLRATSTYAMEYTASPSDADALQRMWDETRLVGPREHARFALQKGPDRPADTLLPVHQLTGRLRADIDLVDVTSSAQSGRPFTERLRITNRGFATWKAAGRRFGGQVTCGIKVYDGTGRLVRDDLGRTSLPHDVAPSQTLTLQILVPGLLAPGTYELRYDMVVEGVTWFEMDGSTCPRRTLIIVA